MVALRERLGRTLEDLGKGLQGRESERFEDNPYGNAQRLWRVLAPERKIDPLKSAFLKFSSTYNEGVKTQSEEQNVFCNLLNPYRSLFRELDSFFVSLSLSNKSDDVSFRLTVFAPPLSQQVTHDASYAVLTILELPEQKHYGVSIPYNVVILAESRDGLYTGELDQEFVGLNPQKEGIFREHKQWSDELQGDPLWRSHFASETLKFLTSIAETDREGSVNWNREAQVAFKEREKEAPWWRKIVSDERKRQPGSIWPENTNLTMMRLLKSKHASELKGEYPTPSLSA